MGMIFLNGNEYTSSPKDGFPPIIYSDEEREIGVWRDGKPLYQKTVDCGALPNNTTKNVNHNISNIDFIVKAEGYALAPNINSIPIPFVNNDNSTSQLALITTPSVISLRTSVDRSAYTKTYVTLYYTKTTDTAGSGKYTTYGGIAHHYSTSEQVIGTWIDGKPIYERTFQIIVNDSTYSGFIRQVTEQELGIAYSSIDNIISLRAIYGKNIVMPRNRIKSTWSESVCVSDNKIIFEASHEVSNTTVSFIVQYTKTTD